MTFKLYRTVFEKALYVLRSVLRYWQFESKPQEEQKWTVSTRVFQRAKSQLLKLKSMSIYVKQPSRRGCLI